MPKPMRQQVTAVLADKGESCIVHLESLLADLWLDLLICDRAGVDRRH